jgi:hypothetical protein
MHFHTTIMIMYVFDLMNIITKNQQKCVRISFLSIYVSGGWWGGATPPKKFYRLKKWHQKSEKKNLLLKNLYLFFNFRIIFLKFFTPATPPHEPPLIYVLCDVPFTQMKCNIHKLILLICVQTYSIPPRNTVMDTCHT